MKKQILTLSDSNMAGDTWRWYFFLDGETGGAYSLSCEQILNGDAGSPIEPVTGLRRGADVWNALNTMMSDAGYSLAEFDLSEIAAEIAKLNVNLANQFKRGERLIERRDKAAAKTDSDCREKILAPYKSIIDEYVLKFSDEPLRGYGTERIWAKRFIEQYVLDNGRLPDGEYQIQVKTGGVNYSGATHDFSDIKLIKTSA